jgi:hypothetical protein
VTPEEQACYDRLRVENAALLKLVSEYERDFVATCSLHAHANLLTENAALREAAGKVTCKRCDNNPRNRSIIHDPDSAHGYKEISCPDCATLRALLERKPSTNPPEDSSELTLERQP